MANRKILVGDPTVSPPVHEQFFGGDMVTDPSGNIMPSLSPEEVTVAATGSMYTSVKAAVLYAASIASASNPVVVRVAPGVYVEDPFTVPTYVKLQGSGWQATILVANDVANHFIEIGAGAVIRDILVLGPTGPFKAGIHHTVNSLLSSSITEVVFGRGYYGILSDPSTTKSPLFVETVSFIPLVGTMQSLLRAEGYASIYAVNAIAKDLSGSLVFGSQVTGVDADLTLEGYLHAVPGASTVGAFVDDGAMLRVLSSIFSAGHDAILVGSNGAPRVRTAGAMIHRLIGGGYTHDLNVQTAAASIQIGGGMMSWGRINNPFGATINTDFENREPGQEGACILGELNVGTTASVLPLLAYGRAAYLTGLVSGGDVTRNVSPSRVLTIAGGTGFINDGVNPIRVAWGPATVTITAGKTEYVYIDAAGVAQHNETQPDYGLNIVLAQAVADATDIMLLTQDEVEIPHALSRNQEYYEDVIGPISTDGAFVSADVTPLKIDVSDGEFVIGLSERPVTGQSPATFTLVHHDALGAWLYTPGQTTIDDTQYDSGAGLVPMTGGKYRKDCLFVVVNKGETEFFLVVGQQEFLAADVPNGPLPIAPDILDHYGMKSAGIAVLKNAGAINAIYDVRPRIGQNAASSGGIAGDHDLLLHLAHDTHLQYLTTARALAWHGTLPGAHVTGGDSHAHTGGAGAQIDHTDLSSIGTKTHAQLELQVNNHIGDTANPHATTKSQVGLGNVLDIQQIPVTEKGFPGGVAALDAFSQISDPTVPASIARVSALTAHTGNTSNPHSTTKTQVGLGNVTDDAQLKRAAGDFSSFAAKGTPVSADVLLIEDSADSGNKKSIQISNLPVPTPPTHGGSHTSIGGDPIPAAIPSGASGLMTGADKAKLDGINPTATPAGSVVPISDAGGKLDGWVSSNAAAATPSLRKLGTGSTDACAGDDGRLSNSRTPTAHASSHTTGADQIADATTSVHGLESAADKTKLDGITSDAIPGTASLRTLGTGAQQACAGNDGRLSDPRTPTSHAGSHTTGLDQIADVSAGVHGLMTPADFTKLGGIASGATNTPLGSAVPNAVGLAAAGSAGNASHEDHVHAHGNQLGGALHATASAGSSAGFLSAADKTKLDGIASGATNTPLSAATPQSLGTAAPGSGTSASKDDHIHAHGNLAGGSLHANVIAGGASGFMSGSDKTKLDGVTAGAAVASVSGTAPIASTGGTTPAISISPASGVAAGSMSAADKTKLDGIVAGAGVFGANYQSMTEIGRTTINGDTNWHTKGTQLVTPALTGTYRVGWRMTVDLSVTNQQILGRLYNVTDAAVVGVEQVIRPDVATTARMPMSGFAEVAFTGASKTFRIEASLSNGGNTGGLADAHIEFWRVS